MEFDQENKVVQLCANGIELEGEGRLKESVDLFRKAWGIASTNYEKFIAAHYLARHQEDVSAKLRWDEIALGHALNVNNDAIKETFPSLYLNIGKCYEDLGDFKKANTNYQNALSFVNYLPGDGYGNMIKTGIINGIKRIEVIFNSNNNI